MEKLKKRSNPFFFELAFSGVRQFRSPTILYLALCSLHLLLMGFSTYQVVERQTLTAVLASFPFFLMYVVLAGSYLAFLLFSLLAHGRGILLNVWGHLLLFFDGCSGLLLELSFKCYANEEWCRNDIKLQVIVGVSSGVLLLSCMVLRTFFYYPFHDVGHLLSMESGLAVPLLYVYKVVLCLLGNVISSEQCPPVLLIATFGMFLLNYNSFYKHTVSKNFWNGLYCLFMWTAVLLYLVPYFPWREYTVGRPFISAWLYSMPFMIGFVFALGNYASWKQFFQQHKINDEQLLYDVVSRVTAVLLRIKKSELKSANSEYKELLECLKEHCKKCTYSDCCYKQAETESEGELDERLEQKRMQKNLQICFQAADFLVVRFQNREPDNLQAQLFEANFSLEALRLKQKALFLHNELGEAQLGVWNGYSLHYLRRKIDLESNVHEEVNQQLHDQLLSEFQHNIEISASMLSEFWYLLSDPKCNTKKLYDLANVIFPLRLEVDAMWARIQPIRNLQSYGLYARYLIELFNDKEAGLKLLEQAKKIDQEIRNRKEITVGLERNNTVADQNGVIFLELDESKSGTMYQVNLAAERIFGYDKGELLNRKVNDIMPRTYASIHDSILENYALTGKAVMMNKERLIWGRSKNGYLFPFTILIKPVKNMFSEKTEIFASIRREPWLKEIGIIVISADLFVTDVSSSMLNIYSQLNIRTINRRRISIIELIPTFMSLKGQCDNNRSASVQVERELVVDGKTQTEVVVFSVAIEPIKITFAGVVGYLVKFSRTAGQESRQAVSTGKTMVSKNFQMRLLMREEIYDTEEVKLVPTVVGSMNLSEDAGQRLDEHVSSILSKRSTTEHHHVAASSINYGSEIKSKRLFQNQIRDVHSENNDSEEFNREENIHRDEVSLGEGVAIKPGELASLLSRPSNNRSIQSMKLVTLVVMLASCAIIGGQYSTIVSFRAQLETIFDQIKDLHQLTAEVLYAKQYVTAGVLYPPSAGNIAAFTNEINELDALAKRLKYSLNTTLHYSDGSSQNMMIGFALSKLISQCNSLASNVAQLSLSDSSVNFVGYNAINDLVISVQKQSELSANAVDSSIGSHFQTTVYFLSGTVPLLLVFVLINNMLLSRVLQKKTQVLEIFFEIPRKTCRNLQKECEKFIQRFANSQQNELDGQSEVDYEEEIEESLDSEKESKKKKRSIEGEDKTRVNFLAVTLVFLMVLSLFPFIALVHFHAQQPVLASYGTVMDLLAGYQPALIRTLNCINSLLVAPTIPVLNSDGTLQQSLQQLQGSMLALNNNDDSYNTQFYLFRTYLDQTFTTAYDAVMFGDLCGEDPTCSDVLRNGLNLHYSLYIYYIEDKLANFTAYLANSNQLYSEMLSSTTLSYEYNMQIITKRWMRSLTDILMQSLRRTLQFRELTLFGMMLSLIAINLLAYLLGWIRFFGGLEAKIVATEYILTFIPLGEINKSPRILAYLRNKMLEKKQEEQ